MEQGLKPWIRQHFGCDVDAFGYSLEEWEEALTALEAACPSESRERLAGYVGCCAEAGERTGRLLSLKDEVLRHLRTFGLEP